MATITPRGGYHRINWTDPQTGKRRSKSLGKVGVIPKRDLDDILRIKEYELSTGARLLNAHRRPAPRFEDYARTYLIWHQAEYPDSNYRVAQIIDDHLIPHFGTTTLNLITNERGEEYKTARKPLVTANTLAKEWRVLMALLNRAVDTKVIEENPLSAVKSPPTLNSKPHHYYQADELKRLYAVSSYGPIWRFLANTGLRRGESLHLRRIWITDAVRIQSTGEERTKAGEWRKIPLTDGGRKALARIKTEGPYLLPRMAPESLSRAFARDARKAKVGGSLHSLRHSYICHLLLADTPIRTVQLYAGHAHISTTEKYAYQVLKRDPKQALRLAI
jgi:integrase